MTREPGRVAGSRARRRAGDRDLLLGRYRLESKIGEGATSTVWRARDERLDRPVAVKILHPELVADATARARLEREARSVARLSHPNVVGVHDVAVTRDGAAVVLEYVPGRSLQERMRSGSAIPAAEALRIGAAIASALAAAHALGIIHRDVKPANILLGDDGRPRLADFGIAVALERAMTEVTEADGVAGTLRYLAPERLAGGPPSRAADVWSLGVVLFEMVAGRPPFAGRGPVELLAAASAGAPSLAGLPIGPASAIRAALDPVPASRPSAARLARRLDPEADQLVADAAGSSQGGLVARAVGGATAGAVPSAVSAIAGPRAIASTPEVRSSPEATTRTAVRPAVEPAPQAPTEAPSTPPRPLEWPSVPPRASPPLALTGLRRAAPPLAALAVAAVLVLGLFVAVGSLGRFGAAAGGTPGSTSPVAASSPSAAPSPSASAVPSASAAPTPPSPSPHRGKGKGHGGDGGDQGG